MVLLLYNIYYNVLHTPYQNIQVGTFCHNFFWYIPDYIPNHSDQSVCYTENHSNSDHYSCGDSHIHRFRYHNLYHTYILTTQHHILCHKNLLFRYK